MGEAVHESTTKTVVDKEKALAKIDPKLLKLYKDLYLNAPELQGDISYLHDSVSFSVNGSGHEHVATRSQRSVFLWKSDSVIKIAASSVHAWQEKLITESLGISPSDTSLIAFPTEVGWFHDRRSDWRFYYQIQPFAKEAGKHLPTEKMLESVKEMIPGVEDLSLSDPQQWGLVNGKLATFDYMTANTHVLAMAVANTTTGVKPSSELDFVLPNKLVVAGK